MASQVKILSIQLGQGHLLGVYEKQIILSDYPEVEQKIALYLAEGYRIVTVSAANAQNVVVVLER